MIANISDRKDTKVISNTHTLRVEIQICWKIIALKDIFARKNLQCL